MSRMLRLTALLLLRVDGQRVSDGVSDAGADELLQHGFSDGHHHGRGGRVAQPHGEKHRAAHEAQHQPATQEEHVQLTESVYRWVSVCVRVCARVCVTPAEYVHARLGPGDHDHPQSDAFMQVPLLNGGGQTDHPHQQQRGVLKILRSHLQTHRQLLKSYRNVRTKQNLLVFFMEHSYCFVLLFLFWTTTLHEIWNILITLIIFDIYSLWLEPLNNVLIKSGHLTHDLNVLRIFKNVQIMLYFE